MRTVVGNPLGGWHRSKQNCGRFTAADWKNWQCLGPARATLRNHITVMSDDATPANTNVRNRLFCTIWLKSGAVQTLAAFASDSADRYGQ